MNTAFIFLIVGEERNGRPDAIVVTDDRLFRLFRPQSMRDTTLTIYDEICGTAAFFLPPRAGNAEAHQKRYVYAAGAYTGL